MSVPFKLFNKSLAIFVPYCDHKRILNRFSAVAYGHSKKKRCLIFFEFAFCQNKMDWWLHRSISRDHGSKVTCSNMVTMKRVITIKYNFYSILLPITPQKVIECETLSKIFGHSVAWRHDNVNKKTEERKENTPNNCRRCRRQNIYATQK